MTAYLPSLLASSICTQSASLVRLQVLRLRLHTTKHIPLSKQSVVVPAAVCYLFIKLMLLLPCLLAGHFHQQTVVLE